jgi:hypothetical protein
MWSSVKRRQAILMARLVRYGFRTEEAAKLAKPGSHQVRNISGQEVTIVLDDRCTLHLKP